MSKDPENLNKWRLILGKNAQNYISFSENNDNTVLRSTLEGMEDALDYLYGQEYGDALMGRGGGSGGSQPSAAEWINKVRRLFPKRTVDIWRSRLWNSLE